MHAGNSVCTYVHGFLPYFYIEAPRGFGPDDCDSLCAQLNVNPPPTCLCMPLGDRLGRALHCSAY